MCTGVFALAWTGLLDGVECTTRLPLLDDLAAQFPKALVRKDRLLTHNAKQRIWTPAGGQHLSRPVHHEERMNRPTIHSSHQPSHHQQVNKGVSTMINVGFIGCGAMGRDHVRRITDKCGNAQVVGVYDTVLGNAKQAIEDNRLDAMKTFVGDGQIGALLMAGMRHYNAQASTSYYGTDNVINDTLIHNFDMLHYMFDGDITSVEMKFARMNTLSPNGESLREPQLAIVEFSDGALATAEANVNCQYGYDIQCRLVGESGIISLPDVATPEVRKAGQISHAISSAWFDRFIEAYDREFDRFFANIEADRQPGGKEATAWDGYVANVVADAALDSLHHGGRIPVTLNEQPALYR